MTSSSTRFEPNASMSRAFQSSTFRPPTLDLRRLPPNLQLRNAVQRGDEVLPDVPLTGQHCAPGLRQPVVAPSALPGALDPAPFDEASVLEPVERRVEGRDVKADRP